MKRFIPHFATFRFTRTGTVAKRSAIFFLLALNFLVVVKADSDPNFKFNVAPRYQIGLNTLQTVYADFDGDGSLDAVAVNGGQDNPSPTITIVFGTQDGAFGSPLVLPSYLSGQTITAGDLNHDGRPDIVAGGWYQNAIAVFLNQGNRQFAAPVFTIPPDPPYPGQPYGEFFDLAIADLDGDGNNDVVALQDQIDQRLRFFHVNAQGSLSIFATIPQLETGTSYERKIEVGDVNGDSRPDVVFAGGGPFGVRNISFVFGQAPGGTLSLTWGFGVEDKTVGISIKDLDNDGDRDLAIAFLDTTTPTRHSLQVFQNNGTGTFTALPKIFLEYPFPPDDITTGDFNNDGKEDIAALLGSVYYSGVMVMVTYSRGDHTYTGDTYYAVSGSSSIFSADVDHDNKTDLLTASSFGLQSDYSAYTGVSNNAISVLFNDSSQAFKAPLVKLWGPNFIDAADYNNDGFRDMISSWATSFNTMSGADVSINDTRHGFYEEVSYASPAALSDMKAGDFNGDGKADAVTAHGYNSRKLAVYFGNATGSLATPITTSFSEALNKIIVGDFNRDGKDDAFVVDAASRGYCMLSTGNGTFTIGANSPITLPDSNPGLQKGDFNNDEKLDLIITGGGSVKLWLGDGMGQFTQSAAVIPAVGNIAPGDINGDGNLDLVGTTAPSGSLPPWRTDNAVVGILGNGNASFGTPFSKNIPNFSHNTTTSLVTGDFNFDGFDDAAMIEPENTFGNLIVVFSGGSSPSWREPMFPGVGPATRTLLVADFDSDGRSDIEYLGDNARGVIYNTGGAVARKPPFDFDGDGKTDVGIYRPNGANGAEWWINRSATDTLFATQFGAPTDKVVSVDFTGDGKADVAFWRPSTGFWYVSRSEDLSYFAVPFGSNGDIPVPADYDGDGKADRAVFRPSNTTWYIDQSGGGTRIESFGSAGDKPVPADYDGDGKADIAIFRPTGGSGSGEWWINRSTAGLQALVFGVSTDKPVQGDYTGDGKADIAFWRPSTGQWFVLRSENLTYYATPFGNGTDIPSPGDYDGDGKFDPAIYRPSETNWYVQRSTAGLLIRQFGAAGDQPLPNSFVP